MHWSISFKAVCSAALCTAVTREKAILNAPKVAPSGNKWVGNMLMFHVDVNMKRLKIRFKNDSFQWFRVDSFFWETMAVSQYAFFSELASLCSRSTSSLTVEVQFQFSRTQVQRTHESARMCSLYRGCIECRLERIEPLEIPEDAARGRCTEACKL